MQTNKTDPVVADVVGGVGLATLAFSGSLKATSGFSWIPVDLTLAAAIIVFVTSCTIGVRSLWRGKTSPIFMMPLALWILFLLPLPGTPNDDYAIGKVTALFTVTLLCALAPFTILNKLAGQVAFMSGLLAIGLLATGGVLLGSQSVVYDYSNRLALQGATTITTAQMIAAGALLAFLGFFAAASKTLRMFSLVAASIMLLACFFIGSRGPVIAAVFAIIVMLCAAKTLRRNILPGLLLVAAMLSVSIYIAIRSESDGMRRIWDFVSGSDTQEGSGRVPLYETAIQAGLENPLGVGWGGFIRFGSEYPHNVLLELIVEAGVVVALVVVILMIMALHILYKKSDTVIGTAFFGLYCFALVNAMFSSDIAGNKLLWITLFAAFAISRKAERSDELESKDIAFGSQEQRAKTAVVPQDSSNIVTPTSSNCKASHCS